MKIGLKMMTTAVLVEEIVLLQVQRVEKLPVRRKENFGIATPTFRGHTSLFRVYLEFVSYSLASEPSNLLKQVYR